MMGPLLELHRIHVDVRLALKQKTRQRHALYKGAPTRGSVVRIAPGRFPPGESESLQPVRDIYQICD